MIGAALVLAAQLSFAAGALVIKKLTAQASPDLVAALMLLIAAGATAPVLLWRAGEVRALSGQQVTWLVLASLFWLVLGEVLFSVGLATTSLSRASILMLTLPLFGTLLGVLVLGEPIDRRFLVGASLVVGGAALLLSGRAAD